MMYGILSKTTAAVRKDPDHRTEMITQLLLGETFEVTQTLGNWSEIRSRLCSGWVENDSFYPLSNDEFQKIKDPRIATTTYLAHEKKEAEEPVQLLPGSELPFFVSGSCTFNIKDTYFQLDQDLPSRDERETRQRITDAALTFRNAPFLWGGRTPYGIDSPGLLNLSYKMAGITLPLSLDSLVGSGELIPFLEEAKAGDLLFFDNAQGEIDHAGLLIEKGKVIHVRGKVRIDLIDQQGLSDLNTGTYIMKLRIIKSLIK